MPNSSTAGREQGARFIIGDMRGTKYFGARCMRSHRKKYEPTDWRLTMEQIGRELGKIYRQPKRLPRRLRAVLTQLERKIPARRRSAEWDRITPLILFRLSLRRRRFRIFDLHPISEAAIWAPVPITMRTSPTQPRTPYRRSAAIAV
jgi:hypothetical protein